MSNCSGLSLFSNAYMQTMVHVALVIYSNMYSALHVYYRGESSENRPIVCSHGDRRELGDKSHESWRQKPWSGDSHHGEGAGLSG